MRPVYLRMQLEHRFGAQLRAQRAEDLQDRVQTGVDLIENKTAVYGVDASALAETGPSVVSVNGLVASLGVTAFMALATGMQVSCNLYPAPVDTFSGHVDPVDMIAVASR